VGCWAIRPGTVALGRQNLCLKRKGRKKSIYVWTRGDWPESLQIPPLTKYRPELAGRLRGSRGGEDGNGTGVRKMGPERKNADLRAKGFWAKEGALRGKRSMRGPARIGLLGQALGFK